MVVVVMVVVGSGWWLSVRMSEWARVCEWMFERRNEDV